MALTESDTASLSSFQRNDNLQFLKGIGPKRVQLLEKLNIHSIQDIYKHFPRRYEDRNKFSYVEDIQPGEFVTICGKILAVSHRRFRKLSIYELSVGDKTGMIRCIWFRQPYLEKIFKEEQTVVLYGKAELYKSRMQITSPEYEIIDSEDDVAIHTGRITPIYPLTEGLYQKNVRKILYDLIFNRDASDIEEYLPQDTLKRLSLMPLEQAYQEIHFPSDFKLQEEARRRHAFDEMLFFEYLVLKKMFALRAGAKSAHFKVRSSYRDAFVKNLPFELTSAQVEAMRRIEEGVQAGYPMNMLLQGDVGAGKTIVGAYFLYLAAQCGFQSALLVPTEILAKQHFTSIKKTLKHLNVEIALLTSSTKGKDRLKLLGKLKRGDIDIMIGTHSLLNDQVVFKSLAAVIIDEQHKFGVHQRSELLKQKPRPHQLVMTATPIPRTLALTLYGDLDVVTMNELPKGRKPIKTYWISRKKQKAVLEHVKEKITDGEQAYFVFPMIEESEKMDLKAAVKEFEKLKASVFKDIPMGLLHSKVPSDEIESTMRSFNEGSIKVLVSTTVIEVGVDNPNATMMIIENAERFGLSQLHQLRGRVGRGDKPSECFLFGEPTTIEGKKRLRALTASFNGFTIAEEDLKIRGPGDFLGTRQSGIPLFKIADPQTDYDLLLTTRDLAKDIIQKQWIETDDKWANFKKEITRLQIQY